MRLRLALYAVLLAALTALPAFAQWQQWGRPQQPREGACFYREPGFRGDYFCMRLGDRWPSLPHGFNDHIRSIRVFNGVRVRVFNDTNFGGPSLRLEGDADDLHAIPLEENPHKRWSDRISSIAVFRERDEWEHREHEREEHGY
jgi:hypothetical protein